MFYLFSEIGHAWVGSIGVRIVKSSLGTVPLPSIKWPWQQTSVINTNRQYQCEMVGMLSNSIVLIILQYLCMWKSLWAQIQSKKLKGVANDCDSEQGTVSRAKTVK